MYVHCDNTTSTREEGEEEEEIAEERSMGILFPENLTSKDLYVSESFDCSDAFGSGAVQMRMLFVATVAVYIAAANVHIVPFISTDIDHWCKRPPHSNVSDADWRNVAIPLDTSGNPSQCSMYENPDKPDNKTTVPCLDWAYDERWPRESAVSTWNMVCSRSSLIAVMTLVQNFGAALFVFTAGYLVDRVGRRPVVVPSLVAVLLLAISLCVSTAYPVFLAALFFAAGSNAVVMIVCYLILFEVSVHSQRPLLNIFSGTFGVLFSDLSVTLLELAELGWQLRLALFLVPALLVLPAFCFIDESPRWLVAKSKLSEAETVMLAAAEDNRFPLPNTACLLERLKAEIEAPFGQLNAAEAAMLGKEAMRKHAVSMFACNFTCMFGYYTTLFSPIWENSRTLHWVAYGAAVFAYIVTNVLIRRMTMLSTISGLLGILFGLHCLVSATVVVAPMIVNEVLLVVARALYVVAIIIVLCYPLELFPTAVRGVTECCAYSCSVLGAASAAVAVVLNHMERYEVSFALPALLLFGSLLSLRSIPRTTTVECAKTTVNRVAADTAKRDMEHMKKTLELTTAPLARRKSRANIGTRPALSDSQQKWW